MARYNEININKNIDKKSPKPIQKFGGKDGRKDYSELANSKKIISPNGGRR